jgi:hypothetical protein
MTKRALIENNTNRVVQVVATEADQFEVHAGLYWTSCPDNTESYFLLLEDGTFEDPHAANRDAFGNTVEPFYMQRMRGYASGGEQMDMIYKELMATGTLSPTGPWASHITAVKAAIPKPTILTPQTDVVRQTVVVPTNPGPGYGQAAPHTGGADIVNGQ